MQLKFLDGLTCDVGGCDVCACSVPQLASNLLSTLAARVYVKNGYRDAQVCQKFRDLLEKLCEVFPGIRDAGNESVHVNYHVDNRIQKRWVQLKSIKLATILLHELKGEDCK